jgi:hypothetical protein
MIERRRCIYFLRLNGLVSDLDKDLGREREEISPDGD